jgi:O-antigen ligase
VLWVWIFAIAFSQIMCNNRMKVIYKVPLAILLGTAFYFRVIVTPYWSSGWVPAVAAMTVIGLIQLRWVGVSMGVAGGFAYVIYGAVFSNLLLADNEYSYDTRIEAWQIAAQVFKTNPIFGLGPSNYYNYTSLYPIRGYFVPFNSHNNYVDLLLEVGLVGFLIFLWMLFEIWRTGWRIKETVPPGFAYAYVVGCLGGVVGTAVAAMFGDWVIPFVYNIGFQGFRASMLSFFFFGGLIALEQMQAKKGYNDS